MPKTDFTLKGKHLPICTRHYPKDGDIKMMRNIFLSFNIEKNENKVTTCGHFTAQTWHIIHTLASLTAENSPQHSQISI